MAFDSGRAFAVGELEDRRPTRRVAREVLGAQRLAGEEVDGHALVAQAEMRQQDPSP